MKSVQEVANELVQHCRNMEFEKAIQELYSPEIVSIECMENGPFPKRTEGMEAFVAKGQAWQSQVEEIYGCKVSDPIVAGNHFSCTMALDIKMKGQERKNDDEEICVYKVENGKIVMEQFFYPTA